MKKIMTILVVSAIGFSNPISGKFGYEGVKTANLLAFCASEFAELVSTPVPVHTAGVRIGSIAFSGDRGLMHYEVNLETMPIHSAATPIVIGTLLIETTPGSMVTKRCSIKMHN